MPTIDGFNVAIMMKMDKPGAMRKFLAAVVAILSLGVFSSAQAVDVSLRLGQGDFVTIAHQMEC